MHNDMSICDQDFWRFSVSFYGYKNGQQLLIMLQDSEQANVNLVLFVIYLSVIEMPLNNREIKRLKLAISDIDLKTQLLRAKRRQVKTELAIDSLSSSDTYQNLLKQELEMEKQQQDVLINTYNQIIVDRGGAGLSRNDVNKDKHSGQSNFRNKLVGLSKLIQHCCRKSTQTEDLIDSLMTNLECYLQEALSDSRPHQ